MRNGCTSCCFQVNNQRQKTSEGIALMFLFPHVQQQLSNKSHAMEIEDLASCVQALEFMKPVNRPLRKKMQQLHCSMMTYKIVNMRT